VFLRKNIEKLDLPLIEQLRKIYQTCHDTIKEADKSVEDSKQRGQRLKEAVLSSDDIKKLRKKAKECRDQLRDINPEIQL
jgi:hypothetical protein